MLGIIGGRVYDPQNGLPESHQAAGVQHRMGLAMIEGLAGLHALDPVTQGLGDFGKLEGFLERQVGRWGAQLAEYGELAGWPGPHDLKGGEGLA